MPLAVVILAAGQGKRMHSDLPKVLQPLGGRPLLEHVINAARALQPDTIYVVHGHGGAAVQKALAAAPVEWVLQAEQLGTGHAVIQALPLIPDGHQVLVLYGDVPLLQPATLTALLRAADTAALALLTTELADPHGYGRIVRDASGAVRAIVEQREASTAELRITEVNTGIMVARAAALRQWLAGLRNANAQAEYYLTDAVAAAVAGGGEVAAVAAAPAEVQGVNDRIQLAAAEAHFRWLRARELMLAGATLLDPARTDVRGTVQVGRDVCIDVGVVFSGTVTLGDRVRIGPYCVLSDVTIGADTVVHAMSMIDSATVGAHCVVGPYARLRPGAELAAHVHVGNFVEVKNTRIGTGSKANHLTYLGDSTVGAGVNVGAGTITCNYDGANKWPTVIDDGAFIGSGSMLVAPVHVGAEATIGAGTTLTANAPPGRLTLTRPTQVTSETWRRPARLEESERQAAAERKLTPPPA